jgi:hypothetical protein
MTLAAALLMAALGGLPALAHAHHLGTYSPRDNAITANFKEIKFSVQARKFEVALRLFEAGAVRREMREQAAALPPDLEAATRAALSTGDGPGVERALMLFLAGLARNLAVEAQAQVSAPGLSAEARAASARLFLEAIWRYYNLIDFAVSQRAPKISVALRLAFDDAEGLAKGSATPVAVTTPSGTKPAAARPGIAADPAKLREPLQRIARALEELIELSPPRTGRMS